MLAIPAAPFNESKLVKLFQLIQSKEYRSIFFNEELEGKLEGKILIRHDVDFSLEYALRMAILEGEFGLVGNYFIYLRSPLINILDSEQAEKIIALCSFGHRVGVHIENFEDDPLSQIELLKQFIPNNYTEIVSIHRPGNDLRILQKKQLTQSNRRHTYEKEFTNNFVYVSDSKGIWNDKDEAFKRALQQRKPIQLLLHPIWWFTDEGTSLLKIEQVLEDHRVRSHTGTFSRLVSLER